MVRLCTPEMKGAVTGTIPGCIECTEEEDLGITPIESFQIGRLSSLDPLRDEVRRLMDKAEQAAREQRMRVLEVVDRMCSSSQVRTSLERIGGVEAWNESETRPKGDFPRDMPPDRLGSRETPPERRASHFSDTRTGLRSSIRVRSLEALAASKNAGTSAIAMSTRQVFADPERMKEQVKQAVMQPTYNVQDLYSENSCWAKVARAPAFDYAALMVIGLNAIWIAIDTDLNQSKSLFAAAPHIIIIENAFCVYFSFEIIVRFMAFARKLSCLKDSWFMFDAALVIMMVIETWIVNFILYIADIESNNTFGDASVFRLLRFLRITRMVRIARLLRAMPELMILLKGIFVAARSVFFTLLLLIVLIYIFAIAFVQISDGTELQQQYFANVPHAMATLLLKATLPDISLLIQRVGVESYMIAVLMLIFVLLASFTLLNMLVGVLCEIVAVVSTVEREQIQLEFVRSKIYDLIKSCDSDKNERISQEEFESLLVLPEGARILQEVGVDAVGLVDFIDHIFQNQEEISFQDFMEVVLQLRGANSASVKDIVDLRKFLVSLMQSSMDHLEKVVDKQMQRAADNLITVISANDVHEVI
eukprot:TRINITY_DN56093_c0_g1_i1.p1 TRINITY_DN56093_c0_g1~~TRINITY_DN56093_c0_g1_i1.p1  ORF type:complete len:591 (+),score=107.07 TRINITY_DN56093_c0_g1_i1:44-1816(+)